MLRMPVIATVFLFASSAPGPAPAATVTTVDAGPVIGRPSLAIGDDGLPVIAYSTMLVSLRVAKCLTWDCTQAIRVDLPDAAGGLADAIGNAIAIGPNGNPQVAYKDRIDQQLKLIRCTTPDCTGDQFLFRTLDPGPNDVGGHVAMALGPDGRTALAYQDFTAATLVFARCTTPGCGSVQTEVLRGGSGTIYGMNIAIAFGERADPVVLGRWTNSAGQSAPQFFDCSVVPCADSVQQIHYTPGHPRGEGAALAIGTDNRPVLSYLDQTENTLRFARCSAPDCSGNKALLELDAGSLGFGARTAIAVRPDGRPLIAYQKHLTVAGGASGLYVAECADPGCSAFERVPVDVPPGGLRRGKNPAVAIDHDGNAVLAYEDESTFGVRIARCAARTCAGPGDRLFDDGFD